MPASRRIDPVALKAAREKAGNVSKAAAATAAGLTWLGYHKWEQLPGRINFDWNKFTALCDYLGVKPEEVTTIIDGASDSSPAQALAGRS
ncbi:helix-turn-helix domain-containing protein [Deinococcus sp. HMF7604]|uniref:helix-turn-helix domain-containing protein n=1 Tax=Deinococcus betulae TaxID=2873312 RepID=UPI001CCB9591|nr:helix-turn-helix domain-containing protein [Deinococcus betulae]